jgi:hypothetical protein
VDRFDGGAGNSFLDCLFRFGQGLLATAQDGDFGCAGFGEGEGCCAADGPAAA